MDVSLIMAWAGQLTSFEPRKPTKFFLHMDKRQHYRKAWWLHNTYTAFNLKLFSVLACFFYTKFTSYILIYYAINLLSSDYMLLSPDEPFKWSVTEY